MFLKQLMGGRQGRLVVPSLLTWRFTTGWRRMISLKSTFRRNRDTIFSRTVKWSARTSGGADFGSEPRIVMPQASAVIVSRWSTKLWICTCPPVAAHARWAIARLQSETLTNSGGSNIVVSQATVDGSGFSVSGLNPPLTLTPGKASPLPPSLLRLPQAAPAEHFGGLQASNSTLNKCERRLSTRSKGSRAEARSHSHERTLGRIESRNRDDLPTVDLTLVGEGAKVPNSSGGVLLDLRRRAFRRTALWSNWPASCTDAPVATRPNSKNPAQRYALTVLSLPNMF